MEDMHTPEQLLHEHRADIGRLIDELLTASCGARAAFVLLLTFPGESDQNPVLGHPGIAIGNIGPEAMKILARNLIDGMVPPVKEGH